MNSLSQQQIFGKLYPGNKEIHRITLSNGAVLEGIFTGYFYSDPDDKEAQPDAWHFIGEEEIYGFLNVPELSSLTGTRIRHEDITRIETKQPSTWKLSK